MHTEVRLRDRSQQSQATMNLHLTVMQQYLTHVMCMFAVLHGTTDRHSSPCEVPVADHGARGADIQRRQTPVSSRGHVLTQANR